MPNHYFFTGQTYTDQANRRWDIARVLQPTPPRVDRAYTLAEARAVKQLVAVLAAEGAQGVSTIVGGPDELPCGVAEPVVGHTSMLCLPGEVVRRILLIRQDGEIRARELGLLAA